MALCYMICKLVSIIFSYIVIVKLLGTSCPGYELSWVRVVMGTSCPGYESSWVRVVLGTSCPGYELSWVRVVLGTSCLGYELSIIPLQITVASKQVMRESGSRRRDEPSGQPRHGQSWAHAPSVYQGSDVQDGRRQSRDRDWQLSSRNQPGSRMESSVVTASCLEVIHLCTRIERGRGVTREAMRSVEKSLPPRENSEPGGLKTAMGTCTVWVRGVRNFDYSHTAMSEDKRGPFLGGGMIWNILRMLGSTLWIQDRFFRFLDRCLITTLRKNGWLDFHEISGICWR